MNGLGDFDLANERAVGAAGKRHIGDAGDASDGQSVAGDFLDGLVAHDRGDAKQVNVGVAVGEQHRNRVIVPRVAVENDFFSHTGEHI